MIRLGEAAAGTILQIKEKGVLTPFILIGHVYTGELTECSMLLRKDLYKDQVAWGKEDTYYRNNIDTWLNDTYASCFEDDILSNVQVAPVPVSYRSSPN